MDKETALQIWQELYGDKEEAYDYASHKMRRDDFDNVDSEFGWKIDHKQPLYNGGLDFGFNLVPASIDTIDLRGGRTSFKVGHLRLEVRKGPKYGTFSVYDVTDSNHPISMEPNEDNQDPAYNKNRTDFSLGINQEAPVDFSAQFSSPLVSDTLIHEVIKADENEAFDAVNSKEETENKEETDEDQNKTEETNGDIIEEDKTDVTASDLSEETKEEKPSLEEQVIEENAVENNNDDDSTEITKDTEETEEETADEEQENKQNEVDELREMIKAKDTEIERLNTELSSLKEENQEENHSEEEKKELNDRIDALTKELLDIKNENLRKEEENKAYLSEKEQLSIQRDQLISEKEEHTRKEADDKAKIDSFENEKKTLNDDIDILRNQIYGLKTEIVRLNSSLDQTLEEKNSIITDSSSVKAENETVRQKNQALEKEIALLKEQDGKLADENENYKNSQESFDENLKEQLSSLKADKEKLLSEKEKQEEVLNSLAFEITNLKSDNQRKDQIISSFSSVKAQEENTRVSENDERVEEIKSLKSKIENIEAEKNEEKEKLSALLNDKDNADKENIKLKEQIENIQKELISLQDKEALESMASDENKKALDEENRVIKGQNSFFKASGKEDKYEEASSSLKEQELPETVENYQSLIPLHPEWFYSSSDYLGPVPEAFDSTSEQIAEKELDVREYPEEDVSYLKKEIEKRNRAILAFEEVYTDECDTATDFAGREIKKDHYLDEEQYGFDYRIIKDRETQKETYIVASLKSLADFREEETFTTNGHSYRLVSKSGSYKVVSDDYISDPYDFDEAIKVTSDTAKEQTPMVYLFVKTMGATISDPDLTLQNKFFAIIDKTVKRCCPSSFMEMQTAIGTNQNYAFLTFDGSSDSCYREVYNYAILLNSYRKEIKKEGELNAVIVMDQIEVEPALRHLSFDRLFNKTKNIGLRAILYELNMTPVINSTIRRTIHIGPEVLPYLNIDKNKITESLLGKGNFTSLYNFHDSYYECHFVYGLKRRTKEED